MKNNDLKKVIFLISLICINLFITSRASAISLTLEPSNNSIGIGEQFYVDLLLYPEGQAVNTVKGNVSFLDDKISFIRMESYKSILPLWIEEPTLYGKTVSFTGVIPRGFEGAIDPFNPSKHKPGLVIRLVFEGVKPGRVDFSSSPFYLNLNDSFGTPISVTQAFASVVIENFTYDHPYDGSEFGNPQLDAYVTRDPNIYNNKYILIYKAYDKDSGIKNVIMKEGWHRWKEIKSPYLLKDQSRHSDINIQATNNRGVSIVLKINKIPGDYRCLILILILIIILFLIFEKRSKKKKEEIKELKNI